jgi:hypothetical protein
MPKPGQVIHVTTEQEILMRTGEHAEEPGPAMVQSRSVLAFSQTNGAIDDQRQVESKIVIERLELSESYAGKARKFPDTSSLKGQVLAITFDSTGKLVGIKVPPEIKDGALQLTQLLAGAFGVLNFVPSVALSVGEDSTSTVELPMRLPGTPTSGPLNARSTIMLRALDTKLSDRIAHLQQTINIDTTSSQVNITGGGTIDVNISQGFMSAAETEWKISGLMPAAQGAAASRPFFGSIKIRVSAN